MSSEKSLTPQIRFKGFTEAWEQRKLGDIATKQTSKNTNSIIREPFTNSAEQGVVSQYDYFDHGITNVANISNYFVICPNDFVYNPRISVTAPCGPINRNRLNRSGIMSPLYTIFRTNQCIDVTYLEYYFKTKKWHPFMFLEGNTGARSDRFSISDSTFFKMPIQIPSKAEQKLISKQLEALSNLITLHQRKLDALKKIKSALLEKMFPKDGSNIPEIRFTGFAEAWEQRKFLTIYRKNDERNDAGLSADKTLSVATMTFNCDGNGASAESLPNYKRLRIGDVAFEGHTNKEFSFGRFVLNDAGDGIMSPRFTCLRPITKQDYSFWKHYIHSEKVMKEKLVNSTKSGTMMNELVVEDFLNESILIPSLEEQKKIGFIFKSLTNLITLHQHKLDALKKIKSALLEKMFV